MSRAYSILLVAEANRAGSLVCAATQFLDPVDERLAKLAGQPPVGSTERDRWLAIGHYWLLVPVDAAGRDGFYLDNTLDAPLREIHGVVHAGGWRGEFALMLGGRYLVARFAAESSYMSEILCQPHAQNQFRLLCLEARGLALLLQRDSIERYADLLAVGQPLVSWPEWHASMGAASRIDDAVESLRIRFVCDRPIENSKNM